MFSLNESLVYYLYPRYITTGKGIEGLYELIRSQMGADPLNGDVYLFLIKKGPGKNTSLGYRWIYFIPETIGKRHF